MEMKKKEGEIIKLDRKNSWKEENGWKEKEMKIFERREGHRERK